MVKANTAAGPEPKADIFSIGYRYSFTRRTQMDILYSQIKNNATSTQTWPLLPLAGAGAGTDPSGVSFGIVHVF